MKTLMYAQEPYVLSDEESRSLQHRRTAFVEDESYRGSVFVTLVTPHGVAHNAAWNDIQSEVTLQDLFS